MTDISFTSSIRPVSSDSFRRMTLDILNNVSNWSPEGAKKGLSAKTDRIMDCTALGLTDGENVFLMHIIPELSSNKKFLPQIFEKIKNSMDLSCQYLQGILVGARSCSRESLIGYNNFVRFLKEHKIPFSELKGGDTVHKIGYHSKNDEWIISNFDIDRLIKSGEKDSKKLLELGFDRVKINKLDEIV